MFDEFYGLTARPFQLTPDPNFYFESATHRKALSYLGYGMAQSEGFIVITGEVGAGKSTLVAHLMQKIDREQMTVGQVVTSNLDGEELVHVAAQSFGLEVEGKDKASALGAIENFLHDEARAGRRTMLVVDESQNLSVEALEELRMLSNFQLGAHPLLQVLLLGQPEFKQVLAQHAALEQLRQRVIAAHHLGAMELEELKPYIEHRLGCVGWDGNPEFDDAIFAEFYKATGGVPRRVNQVATRLLLLGAVEQRTKIDSAMLAAVVEEMQGDSAFADGDNDVGSAAMPSSGPVKHVAAVQAAPEAVAAPVMQELAQDQIDAILAERDSQIKELQQAVVELSQAVEAKSGETELPKELVEKIAGMDARLDEQERTVRHVLTMMIEWIESEQPARVEAA